MACHNPEQRERQLPRTIWYKKLINVSQFLITVFQQASKKHDFAHLRSIVHYVLETSLLHRGVDKYLPRPGMKKSRKHWRARFQQHRDASYHQVFFFLQGKAPKEIHAILTETLASFFLVGVRTYQHPCMQMRNSENISLRIKLQKENKIERTAL